MAPKTKEQYAEIRRKSTEAIKKVALELFAQQGYHSTAISQIAKRARVSKGLMYNYFESKEALLEAIIKDAFDEVDEEAMVPFLNDNSPPDTQLRGLTEATLNMVRGNFDHWKLLTALALQPGVLKSMESFMKEKQDEMLPKFVHLFERLGASDPKRAAYLYAAALDGIMLHYFQMREEYPLEEIKEYLFEQFNITEK